MSGHTPGPWRVSGGGSTDVFADDGSHVARVGVRTAVGTAYVVALTNARLIAAAPDLLEALEWMVDNDETNEGGEWDEENAYWIDGLNKARAAIKKARGES